MIRTVATNSGHLGPNLGVVELTLAIHRVFDSPRDRVVFDTGHQSYVHKLVTGRHADFATLRKEGGLSGYPSQAESEHDIVENSHASTALSYADGLAKAYAIQGEDRHVVAVIGDGALTGGMAWEALNNIAIARSSRLVIVVNDNERSYTPTIGGLATALTTLRTNPRYEQVLDLVKKRLNAVPGVGHAAYDALHAVKKGMKDALAPQGLFEDLGLKYVGPVDGHDRAAMEQALTHAKRFGGPVIVHAITRKGQGYDPALRHEADQFHAPGPVRRADRCREAQGQDLDRPLLRGHRRARRAPRGRRRDHRRDDAPGRPRRLRREVPRAHLRRRHRRAARRHLGRRPRDGRAAPGLRRLRHLPQPCLRPGADGRRAAPVRRHLRARPLRRDRRRRREPQRHVGHVDPPGRARASGWPRRATSPGCTSCSTRPSTSTTPRPWCASPRARRPRTSPRSTARAAPTCSSATGEQDVLVVAVGSMATTAVEVASRLTAQGIGVTVVDPRWVKPVDPAIVDLAREHRLVVSVEDNGRVGGCGAVLLQTLNDAGVHTPFHLHGIPQEFLDHAKRDVILARIGLDAQTIARDIVEAVTALEGDDPLPGRPGGRPPVTRTRVVVTTPDGDMPAHLWLPAAGSGPASCCCRRSSAISPYIERRAQDLADLGHVVLAPEIFWRLGVSRVEDGPRRSTRRWGCCSASTGPPRSLTAYAPSRSLRARDEVTGKVGVVGFCFGGGLGFDVAAEAAPDALVSYYGSALPQLLGLGDGEATRTPDAVTAPSLHHFGLDDQFLTRPVVEQLRDLLEPLPQVTWHSYDGADHAFDNADFFLHDADASRLAWERTSSWLATALPTA